ncbi:MAG: hypothetical protein AAF434_11865 [Pseudomonadota bacterium]
MRPLRVALIGDYSESIVAHRAIPLALELAGKTLSRQIDAHWIETDALVIPTDSQLTDYDAIWCVPASPYQNKNAAIDAIRYARENTRPFLGTCGGYQHALLEFARNVLGHVEADNLEDNPETQFPLVAPMACALRDTAGQIDLIAETQIAGIYGNTRIEEEYNCGFGFNSEYRELFDDSALRISAVDALNDPRAIELSNHPFFIGVAFQPERSALKGDQHPLVTAFARAAIERCD